MSNCLLPPASMTVANFLSLKGPIPFSPKVPEIFPHDAPSQDVNIIQWFSAAQPNDICTSVEDLVLPNRRVCIYIANGLEHAQDKNFQSVRHPRNKNIRYPLWTARAYRDGSRLLEMQELWENCLLWVKTTSRKERWPDTFATEVYQALNHCPYNAGLPGLEGTSQSSAITLASLLHKNKWLNSTTLDCMLNVVKYDYRSNISTTDVIAGTSLGQAISQDETKGNSYEYWGSKLRSPGLNRIFFPLNIANLHWISICIDVSAGIILVWDSLRKFSAPYRAKTMESIRKWLQRWLPDAEWEEEDAAAAQQTDDSSCGIAAVNAIHRTLDNTAPIWSASRASWMRAYYFKRCIEVGNAPRLSKQIDVRDEAQHYAILQDH